MLREDTVFGPIFSRRLGSSLGINLLPREGKLCNFDCIYCECGWNRDGRGDRSIPTADDVRTALESKLLACLDAGTPIDSITFSGDGEPTLNPHFAAIVDDTLALRDKFYPAAKVSVLTNATKIWREDVFQALRKVDNPILKLDAPRTELVKIINNPAGDYEVSQVVEDMKRFDGDFVMQTMFLKAPTFCSGDWAAEWMDIVRVLKPREIMVYTIDRPVPMAGLEKYTAEEMRSLVQPLIDEGYNVQIKG
ncbi:MAG: radical SAM protein [Bacteroidales bacterium]|nr:radical SAM protein [Bacteroidales bacterium]